MAATVKQLNPYACKTYLVRDETGNAVILIDPVLDHMHDYLQLLEKNHFILKYVIDTHTHADHISGCAALKDITGCGYIMHKNAPARCPDSRVAGEEKRELLPGITFHFFYTPGHTTDSLSLRVADCLFTGDALFLDDGGAGRDDLPGGDPSAHWESIKKIQTLPDNCIVYPAHDYRKRRPSSLAQQRKTNPHMQHPSQEAFIKYINDLKLGPADWMEEVLKANYACAQDPGAAWIPADTPACEIKGTMDPGVNEIIVDTITPAELKAKLDRNEQVVLLDVREPGELRSELGAIPGNINIPLLNITGKLVDLKQYADKEVIVICRSGHRAGTAGKILKKQVSGRLKFLREG